MDPIDVTDLDPSIQTGPFHERQKEAGADFYEDLGWLWTRSFGDPDGEYWAVRRGAGLWDVSALIKWRFTGPDARLSLDRLTTRRVRDAAPGVISYGLILNDRGAMLDEGTICVVSSEEVYFMGNDEREPLEDHMRAVCADLDVGIENMTSHIPNISIQGPDSLNVLSKLTGTDLGSLGYFKLSPEPVTIAGVSGLVTRTGFSGEVGFEFFMTGGPAGAESLWDAVVAAGARPFGLDAVEKLRIELGLVIQDEDYFPGETDPYELSLDAFIDLEGHEFVGREQALATASAPPRRFKTLEIEGDVLPRVGEPVTRDGVTVGDLRSVEISPRFGPLALAVLGSSAAIDGTAVEADHIRATVRPLPFDRGARARSNPRDPARVD